jgi:hypothetical protein
MIQLVVSTPTLMSINNSVFDQSPRLAMLCRQKSIEFPQLPPHPPQTLAARFKTTLSKLPRPHGPVQPTPLLSGQSR